MRKILPKNRVAIETALRGGNKMHAIRLYMEAVPGASMAEARAEVESILTGIYLENTGARVPKPEETPHGNPLTSSDSILGKISYADKLQIAEFLFNSRKIEAIKTYRELSPGTGLSEAKKIIDIYEAELYAAYPKRFLKPLSQKKNIKPVFLLSIAIVIIVLLIIGIYALMLWK